MRLAELAGKRIAVWGCGREGRAALSVLRRRFPGRPVTLFCSEAEAEALKALSPDIVGGEGEVRGGVPEIVTTPPDATALSAFDVVIKSPGISPYREPYLSAAENGVRFTSASAIWFAERSGARTICVTGTKGKSTVTALVAHLLRKGGKRVALAGNIGLPLLALLEVEEEPDWWVIELSSFQTRDFDGAPTVAVINNVYEEHLDWHLTRDAYAADKLRIAKHARCVVVNAAQPELVELARRDLRRAFNRVEGWHVRDEAIWRGAERVYALADLPLPGEHNALNACAALAAIDAAGEDAGPLARHLATFKALPHRLQPLGVRDGIEYVNDSISTTPYAAVEALRSFGARRTAILVGGYDRGVDWTPFVDFVARHPPVVIVTMGANGDAIAAALGRIERPGFELAAVRTLADAVAHAQARLQAGGVLLLSPGAPSFDQFKDYTERGREFARLAGFDPAAIAQIAGLGLG